MQPSGFRGNGPGQNRLERMRARLEANRQQEHARLSAIREENARRMAVRREELKTAVERYMDSDLDFRGRVAAARNPEHRQQMIREFFASHDAEIDRISEGINRAHPLLPEEPTASNAPAESSTPRRQAGPSTPRTRAGTSSPRELAESSARTLSESSGPRTPAEAPASRTETPSLAPPPEFPGPRISVAIAAPRTSPESSSPRTPQEPVSPRPETPSPRMSADISSPRTPGGASSPRPPAAAPSLRTAARSSSSLSRSESSNPRIAADSSSPRTPAKAGSPSHAGRNSIGSGEGSSSAAGIPGQAAGPVPTGWSVSEARPRYRRQLSATADRKAEAFENHIRRGYSPADAASMLGPGSMLKPLNPSIGQYEIRLNNHDRLTFLSDEATKTVTILEIGGHT